MIRALILALLLALGLGLVLHEPTAVLDLARGEPFPDARLEPVAPWFRLLTEPLLGPLLHFSALPLERMLAWVAGALLAGFALQRWRRRELPADRPPMPFVGLAVPSALAVLPLEWTGLLADDDLAMRLLWPLGAPLLVGALGAARALRRAPRGGRLAALRRFGARFAGWLGVGVGVLWVYVFAPLPLELAGERLVAPERWMLADLHAHSDRTKDAVRGARARFALYHLQGVEIAAATEHRGLDLSGDRWDHGTLAALAAEQGRGLRVLPGTEFTTRALHLVLLGIGKEYRRRDYELRDHEARENTPPDFGYDWPRLIADVHAEGGHTIVAHWWSVKQWYRVDWEQLVRWGVDGFEVGSGTDRAPAELARAWRDAGMTLLAVSDYHGYRKALHAWTLLDRAALAPLPADDRLLAQRIMALPPEQRVPVMARRFDPDVPVWLEPLAGPWLYFRGLDAGQRVSWLAWLGALLGARALRRSGGAPGV